MKSIFFTANYIINW